MKKNLKDILHSKVNYKMVVATIGCSLFLMGYIPEKETPKLSLQINQVQRKGTLHISVCTKSSEWSNNGQYTFKYEPILGKPNKFEIQSIPNGVYAIAMYQDLNGNGKLDANILGIPNEPYAFSNNRIPLFSEPSFDKCKFQFSQQNQQISINLLN
jgi:uncharacterized protein (DUF2141 family)